MKFSIFVMQTKEEVKERILNLPSKKATRTSDIHAKVLKANIDIYLKDLSALKMMEIWKKHLDKGHRVGVILMDLLKGFDTVNHTLLLTELETFDFSTSSLKLKTLKEPSQKFWPKILTLYFFHSDLYLTFLRSCCENIFKIVCIVSEKIGK